MMIRMRMLALPVMRRWRPLSDLLFIIHDKKGESLGIMRVVLYLGRELKYAIFVRGSVYFLRDVVMILCTFFSLYLVTLSSYTPVLWPFIYGIHCIYFHLYMCWCMLFFTYLSMCCFFSIFIHIFLYVCNFYFCFTLRCLNEFCLKCFRKTSCENLPCHELSSCKVFQEFVLGLDFIVFNK